MTEHAESLNARAECGARPPFGSQHCIGESGHSGDHSTGVVDTSWRFDYSAYRPAVVQETACARRGERCVPECTEDQTAAIERAEEDE